MFFLSRYLKTELLFSPYDMDELHYDDKILAKLKKKIEGRCHPDYGYIIQFITTPQSNSKLGLDISVPRIEQNGIIIVVTFSAITFKPQKNDIMDIIVTQIQQEYIKGKVGPAEVLIPKTKMPKAGCEYRSNENIYIFRDSSEDEIRIDKDSKLRCRVFEVKIEMNCQMKIMGKIDEKLIQTMQIS